MENYRQHALLARVDNLHAELVADRTRTCRILEMTLPYLGRTRPSMSGITNAGLIRKGPAAKRPATNALQVTCIARGVGCGPPASQPRSNSHDAMVSAGEELQIARSGKPRSTAHAQKVRMAASSTGRRIRVYMPASLNPRSRSSPFITGVT